MGQVATIRKRLYPHGNTKLPQRFGRFENGRWTPGRYDHSCPRCGRLVRWALSYCFGCGALARARGLRNPEALTADGCLR